MAIRIHCKRLILYSSIVVLCICTAVKCKKDDYVYYHLEGLAGRKVNITLNPDNPLYHVGDVITIEGTIKPEDLGMVDFDMLESPAIWGFLFYDQNNIPNIDYQSFSEESFSEDFDESKSAYIFWYTFQLKKKGKFRIMNNPSFSSRGIYSLVYISVLSGKRKPRGYEGYVPLVFTNNNMTYIDIEVVE